MEKFIQVLALPPAPTKCRLFPRILVSLQPWAASVTWLPVIPVSFIANRLSWVGLCQASTDRRECPELETGISQKPQTASIICRDVIMHVNIQKSRQTI